MEKNRASKPVLFFLLFLMMGATAVFGHLIRKRYMTEILARHPVENTLILSTGPVQGVWEGFDTHFGRVLSRESDDRGILSGILAEVRETLDDRGIPVDSLESLSGYGIDVSGGIMISLPGRALTESEWERDLRDGIAAVPVLDWDRFIPFFSKAADTDITLSDGRSAVAMLTDHPAVWFDSGDLVAVRPGPSHGLIGRDGRPMERSLGNPKLNYTRVFDDDHIYEALRYTYKHPFLEGPGIFASWQPRQMSPLDKMSAGIRFSRADISLDARVKVMPAGVSLLGRLFRASPGPVSWAGDLAGNTAAALMIQDEALPVYLDAAHGFPPLKEWMDESFGGILSELRTVESIQRLVLAVTGYRDGVPELLLGIWGDTGTVGDALARVRKRIRENRDTDIIERAKAAMSRERSGSSISVKDLLDSGYLKAEPSPSFSRYTIREDGRVTSRLQDDFFNTPQYRRTFNTHDIFFLFPGTTENDLLYRAAYEDYKCCLTDCPEPSSRDCGALMDDRYRFAYTALRDVVWVATDAGDLERLILRTSGKGAPGLTGSPVYSGATAHWSGNEKIQVFFNIEEIFALGFLSAESEVEEGLKSVFSDLEHHSALALSLALSGKTSTLDLRVRLAK